ncbi:hypothetical protein ACHWQZ_G001241 [Mnemiopsis leidyi]
MSSLLSFVKVASTALQLCTTHDSTWSNVVTVPALPVVHGTTLTLNCDTDYTNLGGNTASCLYGQVVPTIQPPDCRDMMKCYRHDEMLTSWMHHCQFLAWKPKSSILHSPCTSSCIYYLAYSRASSGSKQEERYIQLSHVFKLFIISLHLSSLQNTFPEDGLVKIN